MALPIDQADMPIGDSSCGSFDLMAGKTLGEESGKCGGEVLQIALQFFRVQLASGLQGSVLGALPRRLLPGS